MKAVKTLIGVWRLTRFEHALIAGLAVVASYTIVCKLTYIRVSTPDAAIGFLVGVLITAASFSINDYFDIEVDRANMRLDRPLVSGEISPSSALYGAIAAYAGGVGIAALISVKAFMSALVFAVCIGALYSWRLKGLHWSIKNMVVGLSYMIPCIYGCFMVEEVSGILWANMMVLGGTAFLYGFGREVMKDIIDLEGDRLRGIKTAPMVMGSRRASQIAAAFFIMAVAMSMVPYLSLLKTFWYAAIIAVADTIAVVTAILALRCSRESLKKGRNYSIIVMGLGILAYTMGALSI